MSLITIYKSMIFGDVKLPIFLWEIKLDSRFLPEEGTCHTERLLRRQREDEPEVK
jgi:hypothetical protein